MENLFMSGGGVSRSNKEIIFQLFSEYGQWTIKFSKAHLSIPHTISRLHHLEINLRQN